MTTHKHTNRLTQASSPYLLQHAHNPVDWYEWGEEAFAKARKEDKMLLVSIGYSACHWCHVMERESFEDEEVAALMNTHFVCIKVDREERPDVDQLYMDAVQLLTGRGGWPLNCFALPDGRPVHGGTYFPKQEWMRVLNSLATFYKDKREDAMQYATDLTNGIKKLDLFPKPAENKLLDAERVTEIVLKWADNFDLELGGYTWAPKFPMPNNWELFLQLYRYTGNEQLWHGVNLTLTKMAEGGLYDQVGGGFTRYSTDVYWKVPHFEKMLYDNGQLLSLYSHAWLYSKNRLYAHTINQTIDFVKRELTSPEGLFYSALDADSEGVEGKFYIWTQQQLKVLLGEDEPIYSLYFNADAYGNWEHGNSILYKTRSEEELSKITGKSVVEIEATITHCNAILLKARESRIRPGLDDKIITSWNALMIQGLADAYIAIRNPDYLHMATQAADELLKHMWDGKKLMRIYKNGKVSIHGFAEDYALVIEALILLSQASSNERYALVANDIMQSSIEQFYDKDAELFYFKSKHDEQLATRKIDVNDDVIPSANSTFAKCLHQLSFIFDKPHYAEITEKMVLRIQHKIEKFPSGFTNWMQLLLLKSYGTKQVVVCGIDSQLPSLETYHPHTLLFTKNVPESALPLLKEKQVTDDTHYYLCIDQSCGLPQKTFEAIELELK